MMWRGVFAAALLVAAPLCGADPEVARMVETRLHDARFERTSWGIDIETASGDELYSHNSASLLTPASNRKLFSAAFAAACLGEDRRLSTRFFVRGSVRDGVLHGDLVIRGDGDPSFAGRFDPDRDALLAPVAAALRAEGVARVDGNIVADVSLFTDELIPPSWKIGYLNDYYAAPVDALAFNENVAGVNVASDGCRLRGITTDPSFVKAQSRLQCGEHDAIALNRASRNSVVVRGLLGAAEKEHSLTDLVAIEEPASYAAEGLRDFLARQGIASRGIAVSREPIGAALREIARVDSAPMRELLAVVLQDSQNLYAETLLRRAAAESVAAPVSLQAALDRERQFLTHEAGLDPGDFDFSDGSGLAADNVVTPRALCAMMRYLMQPERRALYLNVMARPGEPGTLRNRMKPLRDRIVAKTGYIGGVTALSGVLFTKDGSFLVFSFVANHYGIDTGDVREMVDAVLTDLAARY